MPLPILVRKKHRIEHGIKGIWMGDSVLVSLWYKSLFTNTRFRIPEHFLRASDSQEIELSNDLTLVLLRGVATTRLRVFALLLKIAQPRGKIAPGTFKFILSLPFSEKIPNLPPTPGVG